MVKNNSFPLLCLPPVGFWVDFLTTENSLFAIKEKYKKQTLRNRIVIPSANQPETLTIPIVGITKRNCIDNVLIDYSCNWQQKHWQALNSTYKNAPFFEFYNYKFEEIWFQQHESLGAFNLKLNTLLFTLLKTETKGIKTFNQEISTLELKQEWGVCPFEYDQVFIQRNGFIPHVSILDAVFNLGPELIDHF